MPTTLNRDWFLVYDHGLAIIPIPLDGMWHERLLSMSLPVQALGIETWYLLSIYGHSMDALHGLPRP